MFGRGYTAEIEEAKKRKAEGTLTAGVVHNKPTLIVFCILTVLMLGLTIYGTTQGHFDKMSQAGEMQITIGGRPMLLPAALIMDPKWTGMMFGGLVLAAVWPLVFLLMLARAPLMMTCISVLTPPVMAVVAGIVSLLMATHEAEDERKELYYTAGGCLLVALLWSVIAYVMRSRIRFTANLLGSAAKLITNHLSILLVGLAHAVLTVAWLELCVACFVVLNILLKGKIGAAALIMLVPLIWGCLVFQYAFFLTAAGLMARWYFGEAVSVAAALSTTYMYCFGSVCVAALFLTAIKVIQMIVEAATHDEHGNPNCAYFVCGCFMDMIAYLVTIFNRFTLALVAVYQFSFTTAGHEAMKLIPGRGLTIIAQDYVLGFVGFTSWVTTTLVTVAVLLLYSGSSLATVLGPGSILGRHLPETCKGPGCALNAGDAQLELWTLEIILAGAVFASAIDGTVQQALDGMTTSLLVCFAEDPSKLQERDPDLHACLAERQALFTQSEEGAKTEGRRASLLGVV